MSYGEACVDAITEYLISIHTPIPDVVKIKKYKMQEGRQIDLLFSVIQSLTSYTILSRSWVLQELSYRALWLHRMSKVKSILTIELATLSLGRQWKKVLHSQVPTYPPLKDLLKNSDSENHWVDNLVSLLDMFQINF